MSLSSQYSLGAVRENISKLCHIWKKGQNLSQSKEFSELLSLCGNEDKTVSTNACRSFQLLAKWGMLGAEAANIALSSTASRTKEITPVVVSMLSIILDKQSIDLTEVTKEDMFEASRPFFYLLKKNKDAMAAFVTLLIESDHLTLLNILKPVIYIIIFGVDEETLRDTSNFNNKLKLWNFLLNNRRDPYLVHYLILWLQFSKNDDCSLALMAVQKKCFSQIEICILLTSIACNNMISGYNFCEALKYLKGSILMASSQVQCLVLLSILNNLDKCRHFLWSAALEFCIWLLENCIICEDVLWIAIVKLLSFETPSVGYNSVRSLSSELISIVQKQIPSSSKIVWEEIKSIKTKYLLSKHFHVNESCKILRSISKLNEDENELLLWINRVKSSDKCSDSIQLVLWKFFLAGNTKTRKQCLDILQSYNCGVLLFQLQRELDPPLQLQMLKVLYVDQKEEKIIWKTHVSTHLEESKHECCFSLTLELMRKSCLNRTISPDSYFENYIAKKGTKNTDVIAQAFALKKLLLKKHFTYTEVINFINNVLKERLDQDESGCLKALILDILNLLCQELIVDVSDIWDKMMKYFLCYEHSAVYNSIFRFLSGIPKLLSGHDSETIYKSARLLWHFGNHSGFNSELAFKCLQEYHLDIFNCSFLPRTCHKHLPKDKLLRTFIPEKCWLHLLRMGPPKSMAELFVVLIHKMCQEHYNSRNYRFLYNALLLHLNTITVSDDNKEEIILCLTILGANWKTFNSDKNVECFKRFLNHSDADIKKNTLRALLKHRYNYSILQEYLIDFLMSYEHKETDLSLYCLLTCSLSKSQLDLLYQSCNCSDFILYSGDQLYQEILDIIANKNMVSSYSNKEWRKTAGAIISVWLMIPVENEGFQIFSKLMAAVYGREIFKILPNDFEDIELCTKYIKLSTALALDTKMLNSFDYAIDIGQKNVSLQSKVLSELQYVLSNIVHSKREKNSRWLQKFLESVFLSGDEFICRVSVYCVYFMSDDHLFSLTTNFSEALYHFPSSLVKFCRSRRFYRNMLFILQKKMYGQTGQETITDTMLRYILIRSLLALTDDSALNFEDLSKIII